MKWVTRKQIRINRAATAWLVRRFIDPAAEFSFVDRDQVATVQQRDGALGFDAPGARYPHQDEQGRCSFEALVDEHCKADPVLQRLAHIVHCADFDDPGADAVAGAPEAAGLRAISLGFPLVTRDDHDTVERAGFLYDALYAALAARTPAA